MNNKGMKVKVTRTGRIMRMLDLFEVIDLADKEWEKPFEQGKFKYGKGVVVFQDKECNCITWVVHNGMPLPQIIQDIEPKAFDKTFRALERSFKETGLYVIKSKYRVYVDVPEDIKREIKGQMHTKGYEVTGLR